MLSALGAIAFWPTGGELFSAAGQMLLYMLTLSLRLVPLLLGAVLLAEVARLKLGEERLRRLLSGSGAWQGRLRAAALGGVLPFCECGAFPVMLGLLRAGVSTGAILTFFLVSPVVSVPAFILLLGFFGPLLALAYLALTVSLAVLGSLLLEQAQGRRGIFKEGFAPGEMSSAGTSACGCNEAAPGAVQEGGRYRLLPLQDGGGCCGEGTASCTEGESNVDSWKGVLRDAWTNTLATFRRILPYAAAALVLASFMHTFIPPQAMERALSYGAPYDVLIAAAAGIPFYAGDCAMIAVVAPLITSTGALGPGIAFIIAGAGTSINGLVFMGGVFSRRFLVAYVLAVFAIALLVGYALAALA